MHFIGTPSRVIVKKWRGFNHAGRHVKSFIEQINVSFHISPVKASD